MKITERQKTKIEELVKSAIYRAKNDRSGYEKNLIALMDWQNKAQGAKEIFEWDEKSTESIVNDLVGYIISNLED